MDVSGEREMDVRGEGEREWGVRGYRERVGCERGGRWGEIEGRGKEESR